MLLMWLVLGKGFLDRDTLKFGFTFSFLTLNGFVMSEVLEILGMRVRLVGLSFGCIVKLF